MADFNGDASNNTWTVVDPGTFSLDGKGGVDTLRLGTSKRSDYRITQGADGAVHVDSVSGASAALHATLFNLELLVFNNGLDTLDLRTFFGDNTPPTLSISDTTAGTARGNVIYSLVFSETVTPLAQADIVVNNGSIFLFSGSGANYSVVVTPSPNAEGNIGLSVKAAAVADASGNVLAQTSAAAQPFDTKAPALLSTSPASAATGAPTASNIVLTFSETVQRSTGTVFVWNVFGELLVNLDTASTATATVLGTKLTIDPSADLPQGMNLLVSFNAGVVIDVVGNASAPFAQFSFTTADDPVKPHRWGTAGNDVFTLQAGNQALGGGPGIDSLVLPSPRANYVITKVGSDFSLFTATAQPLADLNRIERMQFADQKLALDLDGNAGTVAKILGAVFGPPSVRNAEYVGIGLQLLDGGMSYPDLMQLAITARLGANPSSALLVQTLYSNVVGAAPSGADIDALVALITDHTFTPVTLGIFAAEHALNVGHIDLVGLMQTGLEYL